MNQIKLKRACYNGALNAAAGIVFLMVGSSATMNAASLCPVGSPSNCLYNNGTVSANGSGTPADSSLPNSGFTIFDSFSVGSPGYIVTGFDITDFFVGTATSEYKSTNWSLWSGDPLATTKTLVASGTNGNSSSVGTLSGGAALITVTLSSGIFLAPGTYYLGTSNNLNSPVDITQRAFSAGHNGVPDGWENSNGSIVGSSWFTCPTCTSTTTTGSDTAFDILGNVAPEPGTLVLMSLALVGFGYKVRRRMA